ncbi:MAG: hypothetical protein GTO24_07255 [candidate division Zixibacteria bacterium]|nr:hypothetical protein [candidate division Zixibacteria bacterium]
MPITKTLVSYELKLPKKTDKLNKRQKADLKRDIAEHVLTRIESDTRAGFSPVDGGEFADLSKAYKAKKKKEGKGTRADLHLKDDMIESIKAVFKEDSIIFKITDRTEKLKAFNHNKGDTVPQRPFLPDDKRRGDMGTFSPSITGEIKEIINEAVKDAS